MKKSGFFLGHIVQPNLSPVHTNIGIFKTTFFFYAVWPIVQTQYTRSLKQNFFENSCQCEDFKKRWFGVSPLSDFRFQASDRALKPVFCIVRMQVFFKPKYKKIPKSNTCVRVDYALGNETCWICILCFWYWFRDQSHALPFISSKKLIFTV